jgi:hypothetical protein
MYQKETRGQFGDLIIEYFPAAKMWHVKRKVSKGRNLCKCPRTALAFAVFHMYST